jgi:hypothetical protein
MGIVVVRSAARRGFPSPALRGAQNRPGTRLGHHPAMTRERELDWSRIDAMRAAEREPEREQRLRAIEAAWAAGHLGRLRVLLLGEATAQGRDALARQLLRNDTP